MVYVNANIGIKVECMKNLHAVSCSFMQFYAVSYSFCGVKKQNRNKHVAVLVLGSLSRLCYSAFFAVFFAAGFLAVVFLAAAFVLFSAGVAAFSRRACSSL